MIAHLGMADLHSSRRPDYFGFAGTIQRAIDWLRESQQRSGGWGEDAWDTCQVIKALWKWGVRDDDGSVQSALTYVRDQLDGGWPERAVYWHGPCLPAAALEVFDLIDDTDYQQKALEQIWTFYDEATGNFGRSASPSSTLEAPRVWHTAWSLIGLQSFGSVSPSPTRVRRAMAWLRDAQAPEGCWSPGLSDVTCYCTYQSIVALTLGGDLSGAARRGTDWLVKRCAGPQADLITLLTAAAAVSRTHAGDLVATLSFVFMHDLSDVIGKLSSLALALEVQVGELESTLRTAERSRQSSDDLRIALEHRMEEAMRTLAATQTDLRASQGNLHHAQRELSGYAVKLTATQLGIWLAAIGIVLTIVTSAISILLPMALHK
jgi:hypothetical protein